MQAPLFTLRRALRQSAHQILGNHHQATPTTATTRRRMQIRASFGQLSLAVWTSWDATPAHVPMAVGGSPFFEMSSVGIGVLLSVETLIRVNWGSVRRRSTYGQIKMWVRVMTPERVCCPMPIV